MLFDFVGDEDDEDDGKDEKQKIGANKKQEEAKAPTKGIICAIDQFTYHSTYQDSP